MRKRPIIYQSQQPTGIYKFLPRCSYIICESWKHVKLYLPYLKEELGDYAEEIKPSVGGTVGVDAQYIFQPQYILLRNPDGYCHFDVIKYLGFDHITGYKIPINGNHQKFYKKAENYKNVTNVIKMKIAAEL